MKDTIHQLSTQSALLLAILATALWVSWPALTGPFIFDDFLNLVHLRSVGDVISLESIGRYLAQFDGSLGRPLSVLSFLIDDHAWPSSPESFKYTNLMLHLLTGVVAFGFMRSLARAADLSGNAELIALLAMALWLLHPLQLSTSMLVVQRMTILAALFSLTGLWAYVAILQRTTTLWHALAGLTALGAGTLLSMLCKENGVLTPLLAVVLNATLLGPLLATVRPSVARIEKWGAAAPILLFCLAVALQAKGLLGFHNRDFTMAERLLTEARVVMDYLRIILLPRMGGGGLFHDDFIISRGLLTPTSTLPAVIAILGLLAAGLASRKRYPLLAFAPLWFFAGHALESTIFPLELYFEHRNYLPMLGLMFAIAAAVAGLRAYRNAALALLSVWLAMAMFMTRAQAHIWGDEDLIAVVWARENPSSPRALQQYAAHLQREGKLVESINVFIEATKRGVHSTDFPLQAILVACPLPASQRPENLLADAIEIASTGPYNHAVVPVLSKLRWHAAKAICPDLIDQVDWLAITDALLANPKFARSKGAHNIHIERAYLYKARRDLDGTMREYERAYSLRPSIELTQLMAATLMSAGLDEHAAEWLKLGLKLPTPPRKELLHSSRTTSEKMLEALRLQAAQEINR